jgi:uncharacterized repeat protein (TIGR01451 family)
MYRRAGHGVARAARATAISIFVLTVASVAPASAQAGLTITTPYPAVSVQPGSTASFTLTLEASETVRVALSADGVPDGWSVSFTGAGSEIQAAYVQPDTPTQVTLTVDVPADAAPGATQITVTASGGGETARLALDLTTAVEAGGTVTLESDYPSLRGPTDSDFQFNLTLRNDTPQQLIFTLSATGPAGWDVTAQPSGQARAASVTVAAHATQRIEVTATPPAQAPAASYPINVQAVSGGHQASADLAVEITGSVQMSLTSSDQRLNTTATAGSTRDFEVVVTNDGTSPLTAVQLSGTGPSQWQITFDPPAIDAVAPNDSVTATAHILPSADAVAGDYVVTLAAQTTDASESIDIRVTVETPPIWGIVGIVLILVTLGGMVWIFQRYGRR